MCYSAELCKCAADKVHPHAGDDTQWPAEQHMSMGKLVLSCMHTCTFAISVTNKHGHTAGCTDFCQDPFVMLLCLQRLSSGPITMQSLGSNAMHPVGSQWSSLAGLSLLSTHVQLLCSNKMQRELPDFDFSRISCLDSVLASILHCCVTAGNFPIPANFLHTHGLQRHV